MKHYFIGVNKRSKDLICRLMETFGCTLMFHYHYKTMELNEKYKFYGGEWLFYTCDSESELDGIKSFLESKTLNDNDLEFKIIKITATEDEAP